MTAIETSSLLMEAPPLHIPEPLALSPTQRTLCDDLQKALTPGSTAILRGNTGSGKTVIVKTLQHRLGGVILEAKDFLTLLMKREPAAIEETFLELVQTTFEAHDLVFLDDFHLLIDVVNGYDYPRANLFNAVMTAILNEAEGRRKQLVFGVCGDSKLSVVETRCYTWQIEELEADDYRQIVSAHLAGEAQHIDWEKIHRFASSLNGYQLRNAAQWLAREGRSDTEAFLDHLQKRNLSSNVDLEEVAPVDWKDLKGADDVIRELEVKIALPLENHALAKELKLKPKRGVLLAGPPGTGKTSIGRALAHRLKGKFFLIDGTVVADQSDFYDNVSKIFAEAKRNAPAVIFIDDADVIFSEGNRGFYRYLLTQMDGLESASAERVCVILTAMEASALPPAVLRSGRVELWLETRLPDEAARTAILLERLAELPAPLSLTDVSLLAKASRGLTGADLKAIVEDAKLWFAHEVATGTQGGSVELHFLQAIDAIRAKAVAYGKRRSAGFVGNAIGFRQE